VFCTNRFQPITLPCKTTWRDLEDELTLGQRGDLAQRESMGHCAETLPLTARSCTAANLRASFTIPNRRGPARPPISAAGR
jgi:hypothetical protein